MAMWDGMSVVVDVSFLMPGPAPTDNSTLCGLEGSDEFNEVPSFSPDVSLLTGDGVSVGGVSS